MKERARETQAARRRNMDDDCSSGNSVENVQRIALWNIDIGGCLRNIEDYLSLRCRSLPHSHRFLIPFNFFFLKGFKRKWAMLNLSTSHLTYKLSPEIF